MSRRGWRRTPTILLSFLAAYGGLEAQDSPPSRAILIDEPGVGRVAPEVLAPYVTKNGPGPIDQPFRLSAELGRVVIVLFGAEDSLLSFLASAPDTLLAGAAVTVVTSLNQDQAVAWAQLLQSPYKFLPDLEGRIHRAYGLGGARVGKVLGWVVNPLGRIEARVDHLVPGDSGGGLGVLHRAVLRARAR